MAYVVEFGPRDYEEIQAVFEVEAEAQAYCAYLETVTDRWGDPMFFEPRVYEVEFYAAGVPPLLPQSEDRVDLAPRPRLVSPFERFHNQIRYR